MHRYGFRFRFLLSAHQRIIHEAKSLWVPLSETEGDVHLKAVGTKNIKKTQDLALIGSGYSSLKKATEQGIRLKRATLIAGAGLRIGIDPGKNTLKGGFGKKVTDFAKEKGRNLMPDIHGLHTYSEELPPQFTSTTINWNVGTPVEKFIDKLIVAYDYNPQLSEKQSLALELYGHSHFEFSLRVRFVTLVTAVESLCMRVKRKPQIREYLKEFVNQIKAELSGPEAESLVGGLGELKQESISKACQRLVESRLSDDAAKQFKGFYEVRSVILHKGKSKIHLGSDLESLDQLVSNLLTVDILGKI